MQVASATRSDFSVAFLRGPWLHWITGPISSREFVGHVAVMMGDRGRLDSGIWTCVCCWHVAEHVSRPRPRRRYFITSHAKDSGGKKAAKLCEKFITDVTD